MSIAFERDIGVPVRTSRKGLKEQLKKTLEKDFMLLSQSELTLDTFLQRSTLEDEKLRFKDLPSILQLIPEKYKGMQDLLFEKLMAMIKRRAILLDR